MSENPSSRRADPRLEQTRELVLHAARMIIASDGASAVTPTRLVDTSGVARSTIYRHWRDADAIVADALSSDQAESELAPTGDVAADLRAYLRQLREMLDSPRAKIVIAQADLGERDQLAASTMQGNGRYRSGLIRTLLDHDGDDFDDVHARLVWPLFMQRFFNRRPITDDLIEQIVRDYTTTRSTDG